MLIKNVLLLLFMCFCYFTTVAGKVTNEELHSFPKMFHLDDFNRCLSKRGGLYCLGTFELTASQPHTILDLMKQHTKERYSFNRTLLRRGYCLSERCQPMLLEANTTLRFERCVAKHIQRYSLQPYLKRLHYCTTFEQHQEKSTRVLNWEQTRFLYGVGVVLMLNLVGTVYHCSKKDDENLNPFLLAWSIPWNWSRFTKVEQSGMLAALAPLQAVRMFLQWIVIIAHASISHYMVYVQNIEYLEELPAGFLGVLLCNGTGIVQVFILISCFLTGFNLLYSAQKIKINAKLLFIWVLKRLTRLLPVYLLVLAFTITYWPHTGDGPLWSSLVEKESNVCRHKFWTHILFINNLVMPQDLCMLQTWAIAVDMQLYILSTAITLLLMKLKFRAVPILLFLFTAAGVLNVTLAYVNGWDPLVRLIKPESVRNMFKYIPAFARIHLSPWGSMPACFLGLFMAHYYFEMTSNKKVKDALTQKGQNENVLDKPIDPMGEYGQQIKTIVNSIDNKDTKRIEVNNSSIDVKNDKLIIGIEKTLVENETIKDLVVNNGKSMNVIDNGLNENGITKDLNVNSKSVNGIEETLSENGTKNEPGNNQSAQNEMRKRNVRSNENNKTSKHEYEKSNLDVKQNGSNGIGNIQSEEGEIKDKINVSMKAKARNKGIGNGTASMLQNVFQNYGHIIVLPTIFIWIFAAAPIVGVGSPTVTALYVGVERVVFTLLFAVLLTHFFTVDSFLRRILAWRGWQAIGRLAYSVFLLHWCVNTSIVAARSEVISTSFIYQLMDALATLFFTYALALPIYLLLELPAQKFLDLLISVPSTTRYRQ